MSRLNATKLAIALLSWALVLESCLPADKQDTQSSALAAKQAELRQVQADLDSAQYELNLRKSELDQMMKSASRRGVVGVSREWLQRKDALQEKIVALQVKIHELEQRSGSLQERLEELSSATR